MAFIKEFKDFAMRGNVMDLAVGVIIGAAFQTIVNSVVNDLIMPIVGVAFQSDFSNLYYPLVDGIPEKLPLEEARAIGPVFAWGNFITVLLNFIILAFVIFMLVKLINSIRKKEEAKPAAPPAPTTQEKLLMEIRDSLKK